MLWNQLHQLPLHQPARQGHHARALGIQIPRRASDAQEETTMSRVSIWVQLEAKPGKEKEVEEFLKSAQPLAEREPETERAECEAAGSDYGQERGCRH